VFTARYGLGLQIQVNYYFRVRTLPYLLSGETEENLGEQKCNLCRYS